MSRYEKKPKPYLAGILKQAILEIANMEAGIGSPLDFGNGCSDCDTCEEMIAIARKALDEVQRLEAEINGA